MRPRVGIKAATCGGYSTLDGTKPRSTNRGLAVPKGSEYQGSLERLDAYRALIERHGKAEVKGAKNPYTSRNGWMTSFLDPDGLICIRLDSSALAEAIEAGAATVEQYGRKMSDFAALPVDLGDQEADVWFARSWKQAGMLDPK